MKPFPCGFVSRRRQSHAAKIHLSEGNPVFLNGNCVIPDAQLPGVAARGPIGLQHHGGKRDGKWTGPPSLLQFKNIFVKELAE